MKKFSRCALILIIVALLGAIGGYVFENSTTTPVYSSTARIIVTPGEKNEATVRATDGGLVKDFEVVFASSTVISAAQKTAGTSEDIGQYLTVNTVPNSNIVELTVTNPDQTTAKNYVDAVAKNVSKTTSILTVESIQVLEYGDESNIAFKPDVLKNAGIIAAIVAAICLVVELIIVFVLNAFKDDDESDEELTYGRGYGMVPAGYMLAYNKEEINHAGITSDDEDDDEEDEDEKFNKAIGVDAYKEELGKLGGDDTKKKKKKSKKAEEAEPVYEEAEDEAEEIEDDADEESVVDNVVAFGGNYANAEADNANSDDEEDLEDEYYDEDDDEEETPVMASVASFEAAAAKEAETNGSETKNAETKNTETNEAEKPEKTDKKAMKSSAEVLATIKK